MHVLLTRPYYQSLEMKRQLEEIGCRVSIEPILEITSVQYNYEIYKNSKALIATSAHASFEILKQNYIDKAIPVYAVGSATAKTLKSRGFSHVYEAEGTSKSLLSIIQQRHKPKDGLITYLSGWHVTQDLACALAKEGYDAQRVVCYKAVPRKSLSPNTTAMLKRREIDCVVLMSYRTASYFNDLNKKARTLKRLNSVRIVTMSHHISTALERKNYGPLLVTPATTASSIVQAIEQLKITHRFKQPRPFLFCKTLNH